MGILKSLFGLADTPKIAANCGSLDGPCLYITILDVSPSMFTDDMQGKTRFIAAVNANEAMCVKLALSHPHALVGLILFWEESRVYFDPQLIDRSFFDKIINLEKKELFGEGTSVGAGIQRSAFYFRQFAHIRHRRAIVLTDGHSNSGPDAVAEAQKLKDAGVQIDVIGFASESSAVNEHELRQVASVVDGKTRYWFINNSPDLIARFEDLALREIK